MFLKNLTKIFVILTAIILIAGFISGLVMCLQTGLHMLSGFAGEKFLMDGADLTVLVKIFLGLLTFVVLAGLMLGVMLCMIPYIVALWAVYAILVLIHYIVQKCNKKKQEPITQEISI